VKMGSISVCGEVRARPGVVSNHFILSLYDPVKSDVRAYVSSGRAFGGSNKARSWMAMIYGHDWTLDVVLKMERETGLPKADW
jgi:hypothetical protein